MNLPHLRKTVTIRFSSLRNGFGPNLGVIFDVDTMVEREAYRVRVGNDWKWQIKGLNNLSQYDYYAEADQDILDEYGSEIDVEILK